jgi:hypothetical protein
MRQPSGVRTKVSWYQSPTNINCWTPSFSGRYMGLWHSVRAVAVSRARLTWLMATLLGELERTGSRYGLQTMCEGGGQANVTILERL